MKTYREVTIMDIGKRLKALREEQNLTQEDVGNKIGVTKATVNRYETGEIDIKRTIAIKLGNLFNVSPAYIMGWTDVPSQELNKHSPFFITNSEKALIEAYRSHPEMQVAVNKMLDIMENIAKPTQQPSIGAEIADDITKLINMPTHTKLK